LLLVVEEVVAMQLILMSLEQVVLVVDCLMEPSQLRLERLYQSLLDLVDKMEILEAPEVHQP
jgi:hypothetical protein